MYLFIRKKCDTLILVNILAALCDRLLDFDENVRKQVVAVICDVACHALNAIPLETVKLVAERLRDKSVNMPFPSICFCFFCNHPVIVVLCILMSNGFFCS
jgi:hypothetical protein